MTLHEAYKALLDRLESLSWDDAEAIALRKVICKALGVRKWEDALNLIAPREA